MKFSTRFLTLLAAAAALATGCRQEEADYDLPSIKIEGSGLTVDSETKKASYAAGQDLTVLNLSVTATRDWTAEIEWDADEVPWIAVTPETGEGTGVPQKAKVTILENAGYNRAKQIKFNINYDYKTLYITQTGEKGEEIVGTLDNPYTVAGVIKYVKTLGSDVQSPEMVYVKGIISRIADAGTFTEGGTFGNATFYISDDGSTTNEFYCYRILYLGNQKYQAGQTDIKVGDEVIVCGKVVNYKGSTPETVQGSSFLYELNGVSQGGEVTPTGEAKGSGTLEDPYNPVGASAYTSTLPADTNSDNDVYVKGIISKITGTFTDGGTYGNATFYISEDGSTGNDFYCFRVLYLGNQKYQSGQTDIKVGDEVVICGKVVNYKGNTPETVAGQAYLYSLNGDTGGVTPPAPSGEVKSVTVAEFNAAAESQTQVYELVGTIGGSINTTYGNFDLTDETGTVYVYGLTATDNGYGTKNDQSYASLGLKEGDKIKIRGYRGSYNDKIEVVYAWFIEKVDDSGSGTGDVKAVTVAEFNAAAESQTQVYELVGTIGGSINTTYGNFDLTDETGTVYVYGLTATELGYGAKNDKSYASLELKEGDKIKIRGYRGSYNDKIEVLNAWFIEKVTSDDTSGSSVSFATNSSAQTWTSETDATYGAGFSSTTQGVKVGYYKYGSSSAAVEPKDAEVRIYKGSALAITAPSGKTFKKIVITTPGTGSGQYCVDMTGVEGGGSGTADKSALTITWTGSASKVVLQAASAQVRMSSLELTFE